MTFHIGPKTYNLRITPGPLTLDGKPTRVAPVEADKQILISADCPINERYAALVFGLMRTWVWHSGAPDSVVGWCDLTSLAMEQLRRDLMAAGGIEGLTRLEAGEGPQPGAMRVTISKARYCMYCNTPVAGGSVVCRSLGNGHVFMRLYCESCNAIQQWEETESMTGMPTGVPVAKPRTIRDPDAIRKFLQRHPEAAPDVSMV